MAQALYGAGRLTSAPEGMLPGVVPLELVLARSAKAAVYITHLAADPTGSQFEIHAIAAPKRTSSSLTR